jgi:hypothetical protein
MLLHPIRPNLGAEEEPTNKQVQEIQKRITNAVLQTVFKHIICQDLEEAVRKIIADRIAGWNWEIDLEEKLPFMTRVNVVVGAVSRSKRRWSFQLVAVIIF